MGLFKRKKKNKLLVSLNRLASMCNGYSSEYDKVVYELHPLLTEFVGQEHIIYKNFESIIQSKEYDGTKLLRLRATIRALITIIESKQVDKRYQIFISSTYKDLISYRMSIYNELTSRGHIAAGMEDFAACSDNLDKYIKNVIDQSDYYVLIIGQRFGSTIPYNDKMSYTMMEYEYAKKKGMRIIPLIYNGKASLEGSDLDVNKDKFDNFVAQIAETVPQYFKDENELIRKLTRALEVEMQNYPQKGWIRL